LLMRNKEIEVLFPTFLVPQILIVAVQEVREAKREVEKDIQTLLEERQQEQEQLAVRTDALRQQEVHTIMLPEVLSDVGLLG
jgi:hypothetical protein